MWPTLNRGFFLMLSVAQWRYGSAFSHQRRLPADLDTLSLSPLRPFRPLHMFQIRTSAVGRSPPILLGLALDRWRFRVLDLDPMRRSDEKPLLSEFNALLKNLCHFVLATWAFTGALIMPLRRASGRNTRPPSPCHASCAQRGQSRIFA